MERTQFKTFNIERLKLIAIEAIEQSNQNLIPQINIPIYFEEFIQGNNKTILACCLTEEADRVGQVLNSNKLNINGILIGPEGDFSDNEINTIQNNNFIVPVSLGNNVLKSETACIVASSLIKEYLSHAN
jgi:16S rRNA (uracil1498-N3)-methyltransferase